MGNPYFSIIVVSFNAEMYIKETINSVLKQKFEDYEIIVKDACSKDKTLENIPADDRIRVYSTKDSGIYDGMNQAISYAKGKYCTFLNCGDTFYDENVLDNVYKSSLESDAHGTIIYGDCYRREGYVKQPSQITGFYLFRTPLNHQSMFFETSVLNDLGGYNTDLKIAADYDFTVHAFKSGVKFLYCPAVICSYLGGGVSESQKGQEIKKKDYEYIYNTYFTKSEKTKYQIKLFLSMRWLRQKLASDKSPLWVRRLYRGFVNKVNK